LQDGGACGLAGEVLGGVRAFKKIQRNAASAAGGAAGGAAGSIAGCGVLGDDEDVEAGEGLCIGGEGAVGGGDEDAAQLVVEAGADLGDAGVEVAGGAVGALDERQLGGDLGVGGGSGDGVEGGLVRGVAEAGDALLGWAAGDERGGAGGAQEAG
jgi:hypothetical protein